MKLENSFQFYGMLILVKTAFSWMECYKQENEEFKGKNVGLICQKSRVELEPCNLLWETLSKLLNHAVPQFLHL